mmetsp:Transcript_76408/g.151163  ORF Transcript_76408/g.151163 Transcript_76408/m.151163 type:complete len:139 (+) Transcript_76408:120-536(+)|eukprot:CAMPEP_0172860640 /NCGR_PEP_ID=MMETSP1075-20121228/72203_1 /TAXON_ID=2916 /ORGANISM="Ceratium fusus, Strain PA161109" /LENGTH=138 /DNA_ID=CAMNT_0013708691 /DNA_START=120 /DNA_END=536 /DNA_ORIENTATION=-
MHRLWVALAGLAVILLASEDRHWSALAKDKEEVVGWLDGSDAMKLKHPKRKHPNFQACLEKAEKLEEEHGNFDDELSDVQKGSIADGLKGIVKDLLGKHKDDFHEKLHVKLGAGDAKRTEGFGALDACDFIFEHHEEL